MRKIGDKKGLSPVVATVLLIAIVVILAIIIFLWARGFVAERAEKFGRAVEVSCSDVSFESGVADIGGSYVLDVVNRGDVPLYGLEVKVLGTGSVVVKDIFTNTINIGSAVSVDLDDVSPGDEILLVPVILGETNSGKVAFTCPDETGFATFVP